eukprot:SAG22_NODE_13317_length_410_cov_1.707395_1_plen_105_part_10
MDSRFDGHVNLATKLDRVLTFLSNETGNLTSHTMADPASVTVHGTAEAQEAMRISGDFTTSTWCEDAPERPNTTNITIHVLLGFSNDTNESYPMLPCNHSFDLEG